MACGCGCGSPSQASCCGGGGYTRPTAASLGHSLAQKLIPTADKIRDLYAKFGLRPYMVRIVKTGWSAGARGKGIENVTVVRELLPVPLVLDIGTLTEILQPIGLDEVGGIQVTQISGTLTEEDLRGLDSAGNPPGKNEQVFYEIEFPKDGDNARRRFVLRGAPYYQADKFSWSIRLERQHVDRTTNGSVASP